MTNQVRSDLICQFGLDHSFVIRHSSFDRQLPATTGLTITSSRGYHTTHSSVSRRRSNRVSLFVGRSRGSIGLYRDNDALGDCAHRYQTDSARAQHSGCVHRCIPILACRSLLMEALLAVCTAFNSRRLFWRLFATVRFRLENFDWAGASFLCGAIDLSSR